MLDFFFRRGNPTTNWQRSPGLALAVDLAVPSLNGVPLEGRLEQLDFLGRSSDNELNYFDLGLALQPSKGAVSGFSIVLDDAERRFRPYSGKLLWRGAPIDVKQLSQAALPDLMGEWYWLDTDEVESIAFYEYPHYEIQIELTLDGRPKWIIVTDDPLMASEEQRKSYGVTKSF